MASNENFSSEIVGCPNCSRSVRRFDRFCPYCGAAISPGAPSTPTDSAQGSDVVCPTCGRLVSAGTKFCPQCGQTLGSSAATSTSDPQETVICNSCGAQIDHRLEHCSSCGAPLRTKRQKRFFILITAILTISVVIIIAILGKSSRVRSRDIATNEQDVARTTNAIPHETEKVSTPLSVQTIAFAFNCSDNDQDLRIFDPNALQLLYEQQKMAIKGFYDSLSDTLSDTKKKVPSAKFRDLVLRYQVRLYKGKEKALELLEKEYQSSDIKDLRDKLRIEADFDELVSDPSLQSFVDQFQALADDFVSGLDLVDHSYYITALVTVKNNLSRDVDFLLGHIIWSDLTSNDESLARIIPYVVYNASNESPEMHVSTVKKLSGVQRDTVTAIEKHKHFRIKSNEQVTIVFVMRKSWYDHICFKGSDKFMFKAIDLTFFHERENSLVERLRGKRSKRELFRVVDNLSNAMVNWGGYRALISESIFAEMQEKARLAQEEARKKAEEEARRRKAEEEARLRAEHERRLREALSKAPSLRQEIIALREGSSGKVDHRKAKELLDLAAEAGDTVSIAMQYVFKDSWILPPNNNVNTTQPAELSTSLIETLSQLANSGDPEAAFLIGALYLRVNPNVATTALLRSANANYVPALTQLANYYLAAGDQESIKKALIYFDKATRQGSAEAALTLANLYYGGTKVASDTTKAINYYSFAVERQHPVALFALGSLYYTGAGVPKNPEKALELLSQSAEAGYREALKSVPYLHYVLATSGAPAASPSATANAAKYAQLAVNAGFTQYTGLLAQFYKNGEGVPQDCSKAGYYAQLGANAGDPYAKVVYACCLCEGCGVQRDFSKGIQLLTECANAGSPEAMYALYQAYKPGNSFVPDAKISKQWLEKAKNAGYPLSESDQAFLTSKSQMQGAGSSAAPSTVRIYVRKVVPIAPPQAAQRQQSANQ